MKKTLEEKNIPANSTLIVPEDKKEVVQNANLGYPISSEETIESGFAIIDGNIRLNNDFDSLIDFRKDDLETEIVEKLFQK